MLNLLKVEVESCRRLNLYTVKPVYNAHPWDPKILAVVDRWPLFRGFSIKIAIVFDLAGLRLAVVGMWPLFRGGRYSEVAVNTGLTVISYYLN